MGYALRHQKRRDQKEHMLVFVCLYIMFTIPFHSKCPLNTSPTPSVYITLLPT